MSTLVSIVVPAYNNADYIAETMESVLAQTHRELEVVVADHSSTDGTWEVLQRFAGDPRVRLLTTPAGGGAKANWDRVSREATGDWVKLVCGDDLLRPTAVAEQLAAAEAAPGTVMVASQRDVVDAVGAPVVSGRGLGRLRGRVPGLQAVRATVRAGTNLFGEPACVLLRRDVLARVGFWDDGEGGYYIDAATYARVLAHGDLVALPRTLAAFRVNAGQWSVRLVGQQAQQAATFHAAVAAREPGLLSRLDVAVGDARAVLLALARRAVYLWLGRRMHATGGAPDARTGRR